MNIPDNKIVPCSSHGRFAEYSPKNHKIPSNAQTDDKCIKKNKGVVHNCTYAIRFIEICEKEMCKMRDMLKNKVRLMPTILLTTLVIS